MQHQFQAFDRANPDVYETFDGLVRRMVDKGFKNYGTQAIFERMRWEHDSTAGPDTKGNTTFKVNNNFAAFYARAWMRRNPQFAGFLRTRRQTSHSGDATNLPPLTPGNFPTYPNEDSPRRIAGPDDSTT